MGECVKRFFNSIHFKHIHFFHCVGIIQLMTTKHCSSKCKRPDDFVVGLKESTPCLAWRRSIIPSYSCWHPPSTLLLPSQCISFVLQLYWELYVASSKGRCKIANAAHSQNWREKFKLAIQRLVKDLTKLKAWDLHAKRMGWEYLKITKVVVINVVMALNDVSIYSASEA